MKTKFIKRGMSGLMAVLMAVTAFVGLGTTTAFAASETAESYMVSYPRDGDANQVYGEDGWGHTAKTYMNGWSTGSSRVLTLHCMDSYDGKVCYCIEPGVVRNVGDTYTKFDENFWDNYPSNLNNTIEPDTIKLLLGRIMQYGYQGNISTSWRSQDAADADKMAHAAATQLLVWETVVGERDADFNHVSTGGKDTIKSTIGKNNPLYSRINSYYDSMVASVQSHSKIPSFMAKSSGKAKDIELEWTGSEYTATLTDSNGVLSKYTFSANVTGIKFSVSGNKLTITAKDAPADKVSITATKSNTRTGVIVWSDGKHRSSGVQDTVTYSASVSDPVKAFLNIKVSYGSAKIVKTSEDGKVDGIKFTVVGDGVNQTVTTNSKGEIQIDNLKPGVYTVTEQTYDKYVPQETHRVTVLAGQTATVSFNNVLRRGDLTVTKTSEDGLVEGVKFHLYHICEFAERMEQNGHTCEPIRESLPEQCYSLLPGSNDVIIIKRNEKGYYKTDIPAASKEDARALVDEYNGKLGVTKAQEEAMKTGSMFGWNVPGADPKNYDMDGKPMKPKDRGDAR